MKKYLLLILFATLTFGGCKKFLDHQPDDRTELGSDPVKIAELVATAYPKGSYITFCEAMSDNAYDKGLLDRVEINAFPWQYKDQDKIGQDTPNYYWQKCYEAISAANHGLEAIEKAGDGQKFSAIKGEALVARAYAHFMLVTLFAKSYDAATAATDPGIPYVTKAENIVEGKYERGTVASVYQQIEKDLLEGMPLLRDESYRNKDAWHFNTKAANAFATRFYLFKKDYAKVIVYANTAFPGSTISNKIRPWNTTYVNDGYFEFQNQYNSSTEPSNLLLTEAITNWGDVFAYYNFGFNTTMLNFINKNPMGGGMVYQNKLFGGTPAVYNIPKYPPHGGYNMINLFNAEEVLFNRAEANANLGNNDAVALDMNIYLSKRVEGYNLAMHSFTKEKAQPAFANLSLKDALIACILDYKKQEYVFEGLRWLDILRLKIPVEHVSLDGTVNITLGPDDPRRILQLPKEVISYGLAANPR
ncbi:RagB/SusD family nutrient uptake outer membrane protein [Pedobacter nototheniae]|uniref:RagB/SusD family nutrient uptake outer membrane protein n=1 Tax=Pedobacter nototheniae TaxID=2488994 RepID=UPI001038B753|nr:RagB/SusD family nutrient uptake outer membrane protein [Pedobacter nototheniae]